MTDAWYTEWFNSPYYDQLYKHRDQEEARLFIDNIIDRIEPLHSHHFLDLACGMGRHSIYLNSKGYEVTGLDISERHIRKARERANARLHFEVWDMRKPFDKEKFNHVLNLFTSFGYFDDRSEDQAVLNAIKKSLKPEGYFVFDYLNTKLAQKSLTSEETIEREGGSFLINRYVKGDFIFKEITVKSESPPKTFREQVRVYHPDELRSLIGQTGLNICDQFGDYELNPFSENESERVIFIAQKPAP